MIATLLACLAVTCLVTAWMAHRKGDADRDVKLMLGMGEGLVAHARWPFDPTLWGTRSVFRYF